MQFQFEVPQVGAFTVRWVRCSFDEKRKVYKHRISLHCPGGKSSFDFWGSLNDARNGKRIIEGRDLAFCAYCHLTDALYYLQAKDIDDFASEFCYQKPSELIKAWEGCKSASVSLSAVGMDEQEICDVVNWLSANGFC